MSLTPKAFLHQFLRHLFLRMFLSVSQWMYLKKIIAYKTKTMTLLFSSWLIFLLESFFPSPQLSEPGSEKLFPDLKMSSTALANQSKIWLLFKPQVEDTDGKEGEDSWGKKKSNYQICTCNSGVGFQCLLPGGFALSPLLITPHRENALRQPEILIWRSHIFPSWTLQVVYSGLCTSSLLFSTSPHDDTEGTEYCVHIYTIAVDTLLFGSFSKHVHFHQFILLCCSSVLHKPCSYHHEHHCNMYCHSSHRVSNVTNICHIHSSLLSHLQVHHIKYIYIFYDIHKEYRLITYTLTSFAVTGRFANLPFYPKSLLCML